MLGPRVWSFLLTLAAIGEWVMANEARAADVSSSTCATTLRVTDAESGRPVPALVRVLRADGSTVDCVELFLADGVLALRRCASPGRRGWVPGKVHLHLQRVAREVADQYLSSLPRGDGLDFVFVSYLLRAGDDRTYVTNEHDAAALRRLSGPGMTLGFGEEHRHNFGPGGAGYGHVLFLDLKELIHPVSVGPGIMGAGVDSPPLALGIEAARRQGATVVWCHNAFGMESIANFLAGRIHALNLFDGYSHVHFKTHGTYETLLYPLLNIGLRVPVSTGTDWFMYDFSRVYARVRGDADTGAWVEALRAGRTFVTNGPLLELNVEGCGPGEVVRLSGPGQVTARIEARGRHRFDRLELGWNGQVIHSIAPTPKGGHWEAQDEHAFAATEPGWAALRIAPEENNELGNRLFAHTSPVYLELSGRSVLLADAARALRARVEDAQAVIRAKAVFADDAQRREAFAVYEEAAGRLRRMILQPGP